MAFTRLLEAAREDVQKEVPTPINSTKSQSQPQPLSNAELCDLFSEFLFDIFDANCIPEFKEIEKLELTHCMLFQGWDKSSSTRRWESHWKSKKTGSKRRENNNHTNTTRTTSLLHLWHTRNNRPYFEIMQTMPHDSVLQHNVSKKTLGGRWAQKRM